MRITLWFEQSFRVKKVCTDEFIIQKYVEGVMKPQVYTLLLLFMIYYFIHILMFLFLKYLSYWSFLFKGCFFLRVDSCQQSKM